MINIFTDILLRLSSLFNVIIGDKHPRTVVNILKYHFAHICSTIAMGKRPAPAPGLYYSCILKGMSDMLPHHTFS